MSDFLEDLYYVKNSPWETDFNKISQDFKTKSLEYMSLCNDLRASLSKEQLIMFNKLLEKSDSISSVSSIAIFKVGFCTGARLINSLYKFSFK